MIQQHPMLARILLLGLCLAALLAPGLAGAQGLGAWVSPGPLAQDHAHIEGVQNCTQCHSALQGVTTEKCTACHDRVRQQVTTQKGFHADKRDRCGTCHPDHRGRSFELAKFDRGRINHLAETGFPLEGKHEWLACEDCHTSGDWGDVDPECRSCHEHPHGEGGRTPLRECEGCHDARAWTVRTIPASVFDHNDTAFATYALEGAHVDVACVDCHIDAKFVPTDSEACTDCHKDPHRAPFSNRCEDCHRVQSWFVEAFDHKLTGFTLLGQHTLQPCQDCHGAQVLKPLRHETCSDCHKDIHRGQFVPRTCDTCHTIDRAAFEIPDFNHDLTEFPLRGQHAERTTCQDCHGSGPKATYRPIAHEDCDDCHEDPHDGRFEPALCRSCHQETRWDAGEFDHNLTDFPLKGQHAEQDCESCHPDNRWVGIAFESCADCHEENPHETAFANDTCADCHTEIEWADLTPWNHLEHTGFDIKQQHVEQGCLDCHESLTRFVGNDQACETCHADDAPLGHFEGACMPCHPSTGWLPADLGGRDHAVTGYTLTATHAMLACEDCHGPPSVPKALVGEDCIDCHADDDFHRNLLGENCEDCHIPVAWFRTTFRHTQTGYPLRGAHRLADCADCHALRYAGTPTSCRSCHEAGAPRDIAAHQSAFFPQCDLCHRPYTWAMIPSSTGRAAQLPPRSGR